MNKMTMIFAAIMVISPFLMTFAADPNIRQAPSRPMAPQRGGTIPQVQLTPDFLYQQITALQQQVANLQGQVSLLRSVVQISQNGTTIQAENISLNAGKTLTMASGKKTNLTAGDDVEFLSGKTLSLKGGHDVTAEGASQIKLKAPQIKLNDWTKPIALKDSPVAGGKVISGSASIFAQ